MPRIKENKFQIVPYYGNCKVEYTTTVLYKDGTKRTAHITAMLALESQRKGRVIDVLDVVPTSNNAKFELSSGAYVAEVGKVKNLNSCDSAVQVI